MQSHTHAITYKTIFLFASLYLFSTRFIVLSLLIFHHIYFRCDFSIKVLSGKNREKENEKRTEKIVRGSRNKKKMMKEKIWAAVFHQQQSSISNVLAAHILWQTVSIQLFIRGVWHSNILHNLFSHCNFSTSTFNFNQCVCKTALLLWIRVSKSIDIN